MKRGERAAPRNSEKTASKNICFLKLHQIRIWRTFGITEKEGINGYK